MAVNANATLLTNLVNPQVLGDMISSKLVDAIKFAPLAVMDTTLSAQPGNTITLPSFVYIGDATDVAEGTDIPIAKLTTSTATATVKKAGRGVEITDEAVLSGYGNPVAEAQSQLLLAIASKIDNDMLATLGGVAVGMTVPLTAVMTADNIADALVKFGEDIDGPKVILVNPTAYATLRKADDWLPASEIAASIIISGTVGQIHGCQVVVSNKIKAAAGVTNFYIVKPGALRTFLKRSVMVESDRDIVAKSTVITADEHYITYLYDASKAIKITQTI